MAFPTLVYRCPGPHWGPPGTTYEAAPVAGEEALAAALSAGWCATLPEAVEAFLRPREPATELAPVDAIDDDAPPTRAELEAKAAELGIKVDKRWSDKTLAERIDSLLANVNAPPEV